MRDTEARCADCVDSANRHNVAGEKYAVRPYVLSDETIGCVVPCRITKGTADFMSMKCNAQFLQTFNESLSPVQIGRRITLTAHICGPHMSRVVKIFRHRAATSDIIAADCRHLQAWNVAVKQHNWNSLSCAHGCHPRGNRR